MPTKSEKTITATLAFEKETKNAVRYAETDDSPALGAFGTLYVQKMGLRVAGLLEGTEYPETITVTLSV